MPAWVPIAILSGFLPVWRSGGRKNLSFYGFVLNHTIYGPQIEYVPEEDYQKAFMGQGRSLTAILSGRSL